MCLTRDRGRHIYCLYLWLAWLTGRAVTAQDHASACVMEPSHAGQVTVAVGVPPRSSGPDRRAGGVSIGKFDGEKVVWIGLQEPRLGSGLGRAVAYASLATSAQSGGIIAVGGEMADNAGYKHCGAVWLVNWPSNGKSKIVFGSNDRESFGSSIQAISDCDGDGVRDFAVGSRMLTEMSGAVGRVSIVSSVSGAIVRRYEGSSAISINGARLIPTPGCQSSSRFLLCAQAWDKQGKVPVSCAFAVLHNGLTQVLYSGIGREQFQGFQGIQLVCDGAGNELIAWTRTTEDEHRTAYLGHTYINEAGSPIKPENKYKLEGELLYACEVECELPSGRFLVGTRVRRFGSEPAVRIAAFSSHSRELQWAITSNVLNDPDCLLLPVAGQGPGGRRLWSIVRDGHSVYVELLNVETGAVMASARL